nr:hypothetical protein [Tanacetum cinerariifolium]
MSTHKFAETYKLVAFLEKPAESEGFEQIVDFLNANPIRYALTVNLTIYTSCIQQFWDSTKLKTVNGDVRIQALIDRKKIIVIEASIRHDLKLEDAEGIACLPNATIFEELTRMGGNERVFSRNVTPLFETMIVKAPEEIGEASELPTSSNQIPIINQPSTSSQPQKKQKSKRKHMKEAEVFDLEKAKTDQAVEIASLKKRVKKLERRKKSRTTGFQRLKKVGSARRIKSFKDNGSLGDQEDASKQGRKIAYIDQDVEVTLVDETQGRLNNEDMFRVNDLDGNEVIVDVTTGEKEEQSAKVDEMEVSTAELVTTDGEVVTNAVIKDSVAPTIPVSTAATTLQISKYELTLAQTLIEINAAKPKAITTAVPTTTTAVTRPKARGVIVQEPSEFRSTTSLSQLLQAKHKCKGIMVEPEKPLKKRSNCS